LCFLDVRRFKLLLKERAKAANDSSYSKSAGKSHCQSVCVCVHMSVVWLTCLSFIDLDCFLFI